MKSYQNQLDYVNLHRHAAHFIGKELNGINSKLSGKKLESIKVMTKEEYDKN